MVKYSPQARGTKLGQIEAWRKESSYKLSIKECCSKAGISTSSYYRWRRWAEEDNESVLALANTSLSEILSGDMEDVPDMDNVPDLDDLPDA